MWFYGKLIGKRARFLERGCCRNGLEIALDAFRKSWVLIAVSIASLNFEVCGPVLAQPNPVNGGDMHPKEADMSEWRLQSLAMDAGLTRQEVNDICFEPNGTAWIATSDGLYRFDGYGWTTYSSSAGLPSSFVRSVLFTRSGRLWVGTDKGAGVFKDRRFSPNGADKGLAGPSVRCMYEDPDGTIWFCCDTWPDASVPSGLTSLSPDGRWTVYRASDGLPSSHIFSYFRSAKGDQFAMTADGVAMRNGDRWQEVKALSEISEENPAPWYMAEVPGIGPVTVSKGCLVSYRNREWCAMSGAIFQLQDITGFGPVQLPWMVSSKGEILKLSSVGKGPLRICRWNGRDFDPVSAPVTRPVLIDCMVEAPDGAIWCGGAGLLTRWDRYGGKWKEYVNLPLPTSTDKNGDALFSNGKKAYVLRGSTFESIEDYQPPNGAYASGWKIANREVLQIEDGKVIQRIDTTPSGIQLGQIWIQDHAGMLWLVGTDADRKTRISVYSGGSWQQINATELLDYTLMRKSGRSSEGDFISSTATPDPRGGFWVALVKPTNPTILVCRVTLNQVRTYPLIYPRLECLVVTPDGQLFAGGSGGTYRLDMSSGQWRPVVGIGGNLIRSAVQRGQELWCFSDAFTGGKFAISLYLNGKWTHYFLPVMDYLGKTGDGTVYFSGKDCLYFIPTNSIGPPKRLTILQGHQPASVVKDRQGRLWIGVADTDEDRVMCYTPDGVAPETIVEEVPARIRLDANFRPVVAGRERYVPQAQQTTFVYSWRIDDSPWTPFQELPADGFPVAKLSLGSHIFLIRAQDEGGDVSPTPATAGFTVLAIPLQEQAWFKPAILVIGAIILGLSIAVARQARRSAILYSDLFANAPVAYHELDRHRRIRRVNDTELLLLGYSRREMLGHQIGEFIVDEDAEKFLTEKVASAQTTAASEWRFRRKDGTVLPVLMEDRLTRRRDGSIVGIRSTLQDITTRKKAEAELLQAHEELSETHSRLKVLNEELKLNVGAQIIARQQAETEFAVISVERNRVARELHDTLEQTLAGVALRLDAIKELIDTNPPMARSHLGAASDILRQSQTEVRRTIWGLRALALEQSDLTQALTTIAKQISESTAINVQVQTVGIRSPIPKANENHVLRIAQEAVANALKYAHPRAITIQIAFETGRLRMSIQDDGCGFDLDRLAGNGLRQSGLRGMRARAQEMGGQLAVDTAPGAGTTVEVIIPLDAMYHGFTKSNSPNISG
jgi:PAS domain S-box-containing protein